MEWSRLYRLATQSAQLLRWDVSALRFSVPCADVGMSSIPEPRFFTENPDPGNSVLIMKMQVTVRRTHNSMRCFEERWATTRLRQSINRETDHGLFMLPACEHHLGDSQSSFDRTKATGKRSYKRSLEDIGAGEGSRPDASLLRVTWCPRPKPK